MFLITLSEWVNRRFYPLEKGFGGIGFVCFLVGGLFDFLFQKSLLPF